MKTLPVNETAGNYCTFNYKETCWFINILHHCCVFAWNVTSYKSIFCHSEAPEISRFLFLLNSQISKNVMSSWTLLHDGCYTFAHCFWILHTFKTKFGEILVYFITLIALITLIVYLLALAVCLSIKYYISILKKSSNYF